MNIGEQISRLRKQKGLSQDEFANVLKVSKQTVSNWENEKSYPDLEMLVKISDYFEISVYELLKQKKTAGTENYTKRKWRFEILVTLLVVVIGSFMILLVAGYLKIRSEFRKDDVNFTMSDSKTYQVSDPTINVANAYFTVPKSGHLDLELDAQIDDGELHVLITDSNKQNWYQLDGQSLEDEQTLYFEKGSYIIQIDADGYEEDVVSLEYCMEVKN